MGPESRILSPRPHRARIDVHSGKQAADAGGGDVHLIGLAVLDDFGVAAGDADARLARGFCHGANFGFENWRRQSGFEHITSPPGLPLLLPRPRGHSRCRLPQVRRWSRPENVSGLTTKLSVVMATCVPLMSTMRRVAERARRGAKEKRREQSFDQPAAGFASGSVRHLDLRIAKADLGRRFGVGRRQRSARSSSDSPLPPCGVRSCDRRRMILPMTP